MAGVVYAAPMPDLTPDEARLVCMALRQYAAEYATVQDAETLEAVAARIEGEIRA